MKENTRSLLKFLSAMVIFGTIGIFRRYTPLPSGIITLVRGSVGAVFLFLILKCGKKKLSFPSIKENLSVLLFSGGAMGANWILLFEAYNYTTVATATLCYYMAPIFLLLASPFLLHEKLSVKRILCVQFAFFGMLLVSGILDTGISDPSELKGILLGLGAAVLYSFVVLANKKMKPIPAYDKTIVQLLTASLLMLPYSLLIGEFSKVTLTPLSGVMLIVIAVFHTGFAYALYFGSLDHLPAQIAAVFSYVDPVVAVLLSALLLHEKMTAFTAFGAVLVIGAAIVSELPEKGKDKSM